MYEKIFEQYSKSSKMMTKMMMRMMRKKRPPRSQLKERKLSLLLSLLREPKEKENELLILGESN